MHRLWSFPPLLKVWRTTKECRMQNAEWRGIRRCAWRGKTRPVLGPAAVTFLLDFPYLGLTRERLVCKRGKSMGKCEKMQNGNFSVRIEDGLNSLAQVVGCQRAQYSFSGLSANLNRGGHGPPLHLDFSLLERFFGSSMFSVDLTWQGRFRGARASRTRCLASRQTHSGPFLCKRGQSEGESIGRNQGRSGARDAPHGDRDDRAPQSLQAQSTGNVEDFLVNFSWGQTKV